MYKLQVSCCAILLFSDIDECSAGLDNCDSNADCNNTVGGFECTCQHGYTGDGTYCQGGSDVVNVLSVSLSR